MFLSYFLNATFLPPVNNHTLPLERTARNTNMSKEDTRSLFETVKDHGTGKTFDVEANKCTNYDEITVFYYTLTLK